MTATDNDALARAYNRALKLEKAGKPDEAAEAYRECLKLDPEDHGGAAVRLAAMKRGSVPDKAPDAYVMTLFDQHAEVFDKVLVDDLGYAVPMMVRAAMQEIAPGPHGRVLDLGCGTGLAGAALRDMAGFVCGVDLSENMLAQADERECYDDLYVADAVRFLAEDEDIWDVIVATDVLPYMGDLERFVELSSRHLAKGGWWAVSSETLPEGDFGEAGWTVTPNNRFAHREAYLRELMKRHGMETVLFEPITVRHEEGAPIPGHLVLARKDRR